MIYNTWLRSRLRVSSPLLIGQSQPFIFYLFIKIPCIQEKLNCVGYCILFLDYGEKFDGRNITSLNVKIITKKSNMMISPPSFL